MKPIEDFIEQADSLSGGCRSMLIVGIRGSLNTPADERHDVQKMMTNMAEEVLIAGENRFKEALEAAKTAEVANETVRSDLASKLSAAEALKEQKAQTVQEKSLAVTTGGERVSEV